MNKVSSRSHSILYCYAGRNRTKLTLVDLAGRENEKTTQVTGRRKYELISINKSLFTLSKLIRELSLGQKRTCFRESKLTMLLFESMNKSCQTYILVNLTPSKEGRDENLASLLFYCFLNSNTMTTN